VLLAIGVLLTLPAILLWASGHHAGGLIAAFIWGILIAGGIVFERYRYKPELTTPPGPGWIMTDEKTRDERGTVTVWFNPGTGERAYVREPGGRAA